MKLDEYYMSLALAHKEYTNKGVALLVSGDGRMAIGEHAALPTPNTAMVNVLQNASATRCNSAWVYATYTPTDMCLGLAWQRGVQRVAYYESTTIKVWTIQNDQFTQTTGPASTSIRLVNETKTYPEVENFPPTPNWTAWYNRLTGKVFYNYIPESAFGILKSYQNASQNQVYRSRPDPPSKLGLGLSGRKAIAVTHEKLRDKLFGALAATLVGRSFTLKLGQTISSTHRKDLDQGHNVGALLVGPDNKILGWGLNMSDVNSTFHAETALLMHYMKSKNVNKLPSGCRLYTTLEPCHMCAGFIATAGDNTKVYYLQKDTRIIGSALTRTNSTSSSQQELPLKAHPTPTSKEMKPIPQIFLDLHNNFYGGVIKFLYSKHAETFFDQLKTQPDLLKKFLQELSAPAPLVLPQRPDPLSVPLSLRGLDLAGFTPDKWSRVPGYRPKFGLPELTGASPNLKGLDLALGDAASFRERVKLPDVDVQMQALIDVLEEGFALLQALAPHLK
jgi:tRNA(Arg) A34 adenosine deaminase TadA